MLLIDELSRRLQEYRPKLDELHSVLNIDAARQELEQLHNKAAEPGFWDNMESSQKILQRTKSLETSIENDRKLFSQAEDISTMIEMYGEENDEELLQEIKSELESFCLMIDKLTLSTLLTGEYDSSNAILNLHAGAGGTEAQDWTEMLLRMYVHWGEQHGYKVSVLDSLDGGDAGIKSASVIFEGENAYGYLKSEAGVHRLVRISPFDASGSRHTSFSAVEVMPEIDEDMSVEIRPEDIKMDVFRSSGAGGQHINKTSSAVRLTHIPTGIVTSCQTQRSQVQNREYAMKLLVAKLVEIKEREHLARIEDIKGVQKEIAWGSQIRSYVFMPYTLVKDHRTGYENGNVQAVMDGDLDGFINAYLKALSNNTLEK
ncbi:MAG TPA: peptide chain release factor 2 [Candidatus Faeciplasma avium]|uniref:Peptide chain release factor 2 n=1 Tax=Candidatus Faeciplasma avium TaxID=2840798 RepID=A0A9D1T492_9FIRM|nr:peptide chain release factor 2 [Candidatus Faeciplasma avium]